MTHTKKEILIFIQNKDHLLEFIKPKKTEKSSPFWSSFHQIYYKKVKQDVIRCDQCGSILIHRSTDGTKVMSTHLKACKNKENHDGDRHNLDVHFSLGNRTSKQISQKLKKSITDACVELAARDNRPFETVKGDGFVNLLETIFSAGQQLSASSGVQASDLLPDPTTVIK